MTILLHPDASVCVYICINSLTGTIEATGDLRGIQGL